MYFSFIVKMELRLVSKEVDDSLVVILDHALYSSLGLLLSHGPKLRENEGLKS
jgi:hypothetical protein